jgi:N-acetylglucosamine-6-phosphate deacetylase
MSGLISARHYRTGEPIQIIVEEDRIANIAILPSLGDAPMRYIAPGLTDLQINGYAGRDFNVSPLSPERVVEAAKLLLCEGVTAFYPTIITNSEEKIGLLVEAVAQACRQSREAATLIGGIHLEGPFLSPEDGPRGAHDREMVRPPDWELFERWQRQAEGRIAIVTISPEWPEANEFILRLVRSGVKAAIGHTAATPEQISAAVEAGASISTHLGNGAHLMLPRHPNYLWQQLAEDRLWTCLIADGHHLPESFLKVAMKVKGPQAMLVSDAVYLSGLPSGEYRTHIGGDVVLREDGRLHLKENPRLLAGSVRMLRDGVAHLVKSRLATLGEAWDMASIIPARAMGLPSQDGLSPGAPADFVLFACGSDGEILVEEVYKSGRLLYRQAGGEGCVWNGTT